MSRPFRIFMWALMALATVAFAIDVKADTVIVVQPSCIPAERTSSVTACADPLRCSKVSVQFTCADGHAVQAMKPLFDDVFIDASAEVRWDLPSQEAGWENHPDANVNIHTEWRD